VLKRTWSSKN